MSSTTCPDWCIGGHDPSDDFHRSTSSTWTSARSYYDERRPIKVTLEQHIDQGGKPGSETIVIEGNLSDFEDMMELDIIDAERLATALVKAIKGAGR